jgi:hypothetical protein
MTRSGVFWVSLVVWLGLIGCDDGRAAFDSGVPDSGDDADQPALDADPDQPSDADPADATDAEASDGDADSDEDPDADPGTPGSWESPIVIDVMPFVFEGDTRDAPSDRADSYSCAPTTDESGGEFVFVLEVAETAQLHVEVDDVPGDGVDIDVHVLEVPNPESCVARDNIAFDVRVEPGTWWITADTWVNDSGVELAGTFRLTVRWESTGGGGDCLTSPIDCDEEDTPSPNGVPDEAPGSGGCPAGMVRVADFCMDQYEAMLVEVRGDGSLAPWSPYLNPGDLRVRALSVAGVVPQGYIDQEQADEACREAGKRMCTDDEWLLACRGEEDRVFPNGDTRDTGACNVTRACHPAVQYFETTADWIWSELGHPCINQLPDGLASTGDFSSCVTPELVYDLVGNLHEWTADPAGTFRGGFYVDAVINGLGCQYRTTAHNIYHWDYSTGFRCCAD